MTSFFQFETDFVESLRCIPMIVRFKLDTCGVKLKLEAWNRFSTSDRQILVDQPCSSLEEIKAYRDSLHHLIHQTGLEPIDLPLDPHPAWTDNTQVPASVLIKAESVGKVLSLQQWQALEPLQRFALIKLSRSNHENRNFAPAMQEFGL